MNQYPPIEEKSLERIGTIGRNSIHQLLRSMADEEWMVLRIDNIFVPWRVSEWTPQLTTQYAGTEVYTFCDEEDADEDDLTWEDLIGYTVINQGEGEIGKVESVDETTLNTLLYLDTQRIIPAHEDLILSLDTDTQTLIMNLPLGL